MHEKVCCGNLYIVLTKYVYSYIMLCGGRINADDPLMNPPLMTGPFNRDKYIAHSSITRTGQYV